MLNKIYIVVALTILSTVCFAQQGVRNSNNIHPLAPEVKLKSADNKSSDEIYLQNKNPNTSAVNQKDRKEDVSNNIVNTDISAYHRLLVVNLPALIKADSIRIQEMIRFKEKENAKDNTKPEIKE